MAKYTCVECGHQWTESEMLYNNNCPLCGGGEDPTLMEDDCDELEVWEHSDCTFGLTPEQKEDCSNCQYYDPTTGKGMQIRCIQTT
tara:strand:+ start:623 stop:880 length:258 start_codon:yes stop_codon:yes gene_type:complete